MRATAREGVVERELTVSCGLRVPHTERRRRRPVSECAVTLAPLLRFPAPLLSLHTYPITLLAASSFKLARLSLSSRSAHSLARSLTRQLTCLPSRFTSPSFALSLMCESLSFLSPLFHLGCSTVIPSYCPILTRTTKLARSLSLFRSLPLSLHPQRLSHAAPTNARWLANHELPFPCFLLREKPPSDAKRTFFSRRTLTDLASFLCDLDS